MSSSDQLTLGANEAAIPAHVERRGGVFELAIAWTDFAVIGLPATNARVVVRGEGWQRTGVVQHSAGACLVSIRSKGIGLPTEVELLVEADYERVILTVVARPPASEPPTEAA